MFLNQRHHAYASDSGSDEAQAQMAGMTERPDTKFVAADGQTYISLPFVPNLVFQLDTVQLITDIRPFAIENEGRRPAVESRKLSGAARIRVSLAVAGIPDSSTYEVQVDVYGYDDGEQPDGGSAWDEFAAKGWPCKLSTFHDDGRYHWFAEACVGRSQFEDMLEACRRGALGHITCSMGFENLLIDERDRWSPDAHGSLFLPYASGKERFPDDVMGLVSAVVFAETNPTSRLVPKAEADGGGMKALWRRIDDLQRQVDELRQAKPKIWLK